MARKEVSPTEYPDQVFGDAVYRWTGNKIFIRQKKNSILVPVAVGKDVKMQAVEENAGTEEVPFPGYCAACGEPTYAWESGPHHDEMLGNNLACFTPGGPNEPPVVYCQKHDPGRDHRMRSGRLRPEEAEGAIVRGR